MRGTGVTGSRVHARRVQKENSTASVPMMVQQELSLSNALLASLGQGAAWRRRGALVGWRRPGFGFGVPVPGAALRGTRPGSLEGALQFSPSSARSLGQLAARGLFC